MVVCCTNINLSSVFFKLPACIGIVIMFSSFPASNLDKPKQACLLPETHGSLHVSPTYE